MRSINFLITYLLTCTYLPKVWRDQNGGVPGRDVSSVVLAAPVILACRRVSGVDMPRLRGLEKTFTEIAHPAPSYTVPRTRTPFLLSYKILREIFFRNHIAEKTKKNNFVY